ncbi:MAG: TonB-dependent receptor [Bacteroidales bacterium]|nr:TonB-dependent receptor [Bacteroidales bacterium]
MRKFFLLGLFLLLIPLSLFAQNIKVTGKVIDASNNEPLIGVNVVQAGTTNGTITDLDGKFEVNVPADSKLQFSYIGYVTQTIDVAGKTTIVCSMPTDDKELEQVVVVGYGTMKKSDVSGSVVSVDTEDMMKRAPANVNQGLQGAAAGVMVTAQDGSPDGNSQVRIRGVATINGNAQPLYVVDGVQVGTDANFLNPADIQSIEVLKDASATAIYGAAGANGVIMITTKHGEKGKARFDFSADFGLQYLPYKLDVCDVDQYAANLRQARKNDMGNTYTETSALNNQIWSEKYDGGQRNEIDWQDVLTNVGFKQQYNLSVAGGNENTQAMFSASYLKNKGLIKNTNYERLTSRVNVKSKINDFLEAGGDLNYVYTRSNGSNFGASMNNNNFSSHRDLAYMCPTMDFIDANGNYVAARLINEDGTYGAPMQGTNANEGYTDQLDNPLARLRENQAVSKSNRVFSSIYGQINILKGLTFKTVASMNFYSSDWNNFEIVVHRFNPNPLTGEIEEVALTNNRTNGFSISQSQNTNINIENYLTYAWKNDIHNISAMIGQEASNSWGEWASSSSREFISEANRDISLTTNTNTINGNGAYNAKVRGISYFGRLTYSAFDKYILTATLRRDGSSNFGSGNRWGTFPSVALAWRITQENFLKDNDIISNLKLRLGWGQTGNSGGATDLNSAHLSSNSVLYHFFAQDGGMGYWNYAGTTESGLESILVDPNLKWETNEQTNIGIDLGLLGGQINCTLDYFIRKSKDLLLYRQIRASSGNSTVYTNYGEIENKGIEIMLNYQKRVGSWNFGATFTGSSIKNEVKKMGNPVYATNDGNTASDPAAKTSDGSNIGTIGSAGGFHWGNHSISMEGEAVGSYYGYVVEGIIKDQATLDKAIAQGQQDAQIGDFIYKNFTDAVDANSGEITHAIDENDMQVLGNGFPKFNYGINLNVAYKNWDFSLYGYGVAGYKIFSYSAMRLSTLYSGDDQTVPNILKESLDDVWSESNPNGSLPRLSIVDKNLNMRASDAWVKKADFFKINNLQIGYTLPRDIINHLKITNARVYVSISNLCTFSKYKKYGDPEVGQGCVLYTGLDAGRYPMPRIFQAGVSISF